MIKKYWIIAIGLLLSVPESFAQQSSKHPFIWDAANVYFLLTDRFANGDKSNDTNFNRTKPAARMRGFQGGDLRGIIQKIDEGYFDQLGVNAIWFTPVLEQIHAGVDEGTGLSYGFHGYWTRDWTALDPNFGTEADLEELVQKAHSRGIRIIMDAVINHTGPVTDEDPVWPSNWVRTSPQCDYKNYKGNVTCTLVKNLPDVKTESEVEVELPTHLIAKWKAEGRYEKEVKSLDDFFVRTGYPRTPRFYIIKWLADYVEKYGIDAYRADTVKHVEESVWGQFKSQCNYAFEQWKAKNPKQILNDDEFFLIAEVYNYGISNGKSFDFGDKKVNYFDFGFNSMINFEFKYDAEKEYEFLFNKYSDALNNELEYKSVLNYLSSHDDGNPFDAQRRKAFEAATKLLLSPGMSQIYYGDESGRILNDDLAEGDAKLRTPMNWKDIETNPETKKLLEHYQKLGQFRRNHPSIGAGIHKQIRQYPYVFSRGYDEGDISDRVIIALNAAKGFKDIPVASLFKSGTKLRDVYSGKIVEVRRDRVQFESDFEIVLLEQM